MNRFKSITFDERSWTIEYDKSKKGYYFCNRSHLRFCFLEDSCIVGIEHVCQNTFLIYSKLKDFYTIKRIYILKDDYEVQYENFSTRSLMSLNKETILIKNPESPVVYNVKTNFKINLSFFQDTIFSLLEKNDKNYLYCKKQIFSDTKRFKSIDFLDFVLDVETLQPVLPAFSSLRGNFILLDSFLDIPNLVESELNYKKIVDEQLEALAERININGEKVLLSSFKKKDW